MSFFREEYSLGHGRISRLGQVLFANSAIHRAWTWSALVSGHAPRLRLVFLTDNRITDPISIARSLPVGSWVILRFRPGHEVPAYAVELRRLCRRRRIKFLVSSDLKTAVCLKADGLHLPEAMARNGCLSPFLLWRRALPQRLLSTAAHSRMALARASEIDADTALLSPIFPTQSHSGVNPLGEILFRNLALKAKLPVIALGGIDEISARKLQGARLCGLAAVSGLAP